VKSLLIECVFSGDVLIFTEAHYTHKGLLKWIAFAGTICFNTNQVVTMILA